MDINTEIKTAHTELAHREIAQPNLNGIPAQQNQNAIDRLYDRLNALWIAKIESMPLYES